MKYILDFDHTLFDTARFVHDAAEHKKNGTLITPDIWDSYDASSYLYDDVIPFLESIGKEHVQILTAVTTSLGPLSTEFQKAKLYRSGIASFVKEILFIEGEKGDHVKRMYEHTPTVFIDNMLSQLKSVQELCPEVEVVQIIRPDALGTNEIDGTDETIKKVTSLYEV